MTSYILIIFLAFGGFVLASYIHHKKSAKKEHFICPMKGHCSAVVNSDFSKFLGIPVELLGMVYYIATAIGYGLISAVPSLAWLTPILLVTSVLAFLFSVYLTFIQIFSLKTFCTWCLISAGLCTLIAALAFAGSLDVVVLTFLEHKEIIVGLHVLFMALGLGAATLADIFFIRFLKDLHISTQESEILSMISEFIWAVIGMILLTGFALTTPMIILYGTIPEKLIVKLIVVTVIIINGAVMNLVVAPKLMRITFKKEHNHQAGELVQARKLAFALGPVSIVSWYTAFTLGLLSSIPITWLQGIGVYGVLLFIAVTTGKLLEKHYQSKESAN